MGIFIYPLIMELIINLISLCRRETKDSHNYKHIQTFKKKLPICYSDDYNITACGLEKCHPFDSCKYGRSKK
jgi:hypothetical protein